MKIYQRPGPGRMRSALSELFMLYLCLKMKHMYQYQDTRAELFSFKTFIKFIPSTDIF